MELKVYDKFSMFFCIVNLLNFVNKYLIKMKLRGFLCSYIIFIENIHFQQAYIFTPVFGHCCLKVLKYFELF